MESTSIWMGSTSPLPPRRDEQGNRLDRYAPASDAPASGVTRALRPILIGLALSLLGVGVLMTLGGCGSTGELDRSRLARTSHLAPADTSALARAGLSLFDGAVEDGAGTDPPAAPAPAGTTSFAIVDD